MAEVGYGTDIWCAGALSTGRLARGRQVVVQALFRRLTTPRGTLRDGDEAANYGIDLADYVGAVGHDTAVASLPGVVRGELLKDGRVIQVDVETPVVTRGSDGMISIALQLFAYLTDELDPVSLTLAISDVNVHLLGVTA